MGVAGGWVYQGRQEHGWFGHGTKPGGDATPEAGASPDLDTRIGFVAYGAIGHLPPVMRAVYESQLRRGGLDALRAAMPVWGRDAALSADDFRERFFGPYGPGDASRMLQHVAAEAAASATPEALKAASAGLAGAIQAVGIFGWPRFLADARDRAAEAQKLPPAPPGRPGVMKTQEFLFTPRLPFLTDPPKAPFTRWMERIPRQTGKEGATDGPSWARGRPPGVGETREEFANRLMDEQYGRGNWEKIPDREKEQRQIEKSYREYRVPKKEIMIVQDNDPEV